MDSNQRKEQMNEFRNNVDVLVVTDVASRGIDIPNVNFVIHYDFP